MKNITIIDKEYKQWVTLLVERYRRVQIIAATKVNEEQLKFNWQLGHDIVEMNIEKRWGEGVFNRLSNDLKKEMPFVEGLSVTNLRYCRRFYLLYSQKVAFCPQVEGEIAEGGVEPIRPQLGGELLVGSQQCQFPEIFCVPWGHHKLIMDKVKGDKSKDNTLAQYALEASSQPIGISEYELEKFYPVKVEGAIPSIEEIEARLNDQTE